ncbi:MAG: hypothetical protein WD077_03920 [Bacteroidia bacterium]
MKKLSIFVPEMTKRATGNTMSLIGKSLESYNHLKKVLKIVVVLGLVSIGLTANAGDAQVYDVSSRFGQNDYIILNAPGKATPNAVFSIGNLLSTVFITGQNDFQSGSGAEGSGITRHPEIEVNGTEDHSEENNSNFSEELVQFGVTAENEDAILFWVTSAETDNLKFEIERSTDGETWEKTGEVAGAGNSNSFRKYRFTDAGALQLEVVSIYYRLRQVDIDGSSEVSETRHVQTGKKIFAGENTWYNRIDGDYNLEFKAEEAGRADITLYDINGRVLESRTEVFSAGYNQVRISLNRFDSRQMILVMKSGNQAISQKIIK